jgi:hypothetical protein
MPRPKTDNDQQIAIRVPKEWLDRAQALVPHLASPGISVTRTDVIRVALLRGLEALEETRDAKTTKKPTKK